MSPTRFAVVVQKRRGADANPDLKWAQVASSARLADVVAKVSPFQRTLHLPNAFQIGPIVCRSWYCAALKLGIALSAVNSTRRYRT